MSGAFGLDLVPPLPASQWDAHNFAWRNIVWYDSAVDDWKAKLRQIREALHLTRFRTGDTYKAVAEQVGCSPQQLSGFEKGSYDARLSVIDGVVAYIDKHAEKPDAKDEPTALA